ncbi:MAG: nitroreductase family deazaflavin-dependent oxidoreductase [Dehalococcoidia bacterium]|nr:nitroreductase family deazaflavin-dependent oxidoreductase [Dehalococcoidia bacterium]
MPDADAAVAALRKDRLIDITTTGRKSGQARRIEIGFGIINGKLYLTGRPGRRGWYANLLANPAFTIHLKQSAKLDLAATARPITDTDERHRVLAAYQAKLPRFAPRMDMEQWTARSPLVEVTVPGVAHKLSD